MAKKPINPRIAKLEKQMSANRRKVGKPLIGKRISQTQVFSAVEVNHLKKITDNVNSPNREIANKLVRIFAKASKGEMVAEELGRNADHEKLFLITRKLFAYEERGRKVQMTPIERKIFQRYSNLL